MDENGILRYANIGGFELRNAEHAQAVEDLLAAPMSAVTLASSEAPKFGSVEEACAMPKQRWRATRKTSTCN